MYEILYRLNDGFDQIVNQFQQLSKSGVRPRAWKRFLLIAEETPAEVNFELVDLLQERELRNWTDFGRLRDRYENRPVVREDTQQKRNPSARRVKQGVAPDANSTGGMTGPIFAKSPVANPGLPDGPQFLDPLRGYGQPPLPGAPFTTHACTVGDSGPMRVRGGAGSS